MLYIFIVISMRIGPENNFRWHLKMLCVSSCANVFLLISRISSFSRWHHKCLWQLPSPLCIYFKAKLPPLTHTHTHRINWCTGIMSLSISATLHASALFISFTDTETAICTCKNSANCPNWRVIRGNVVIRRQFVNDNQIAIQCNAMQWNEWGRLFIVHWVMVMVVGYLYHVCILEREIYRKRQKIQEP